VVQAQHDVVQVADVVVEIVALASQTEDAAGVGGVVGRTVDPGAGGDLFL